MNFIQKLWACLSVWKVAPDRLYLSFKDVQAVLGQSFGQGKNSTPGKSNEALALLAGEISQRFQTPLILQWEIKDGLKPMRNCWVIENHEKQDTYLDTYEVIRQSVKICKDNKWTTVAILAHPDHVWRVKMVVEKFGLKTVIVDTSDIPYDPESTQKWTRSKKQFVIREVAMRFYFLLRGWI